LVDLLATFRLKIRGSPPVDVRTPDGVPADDLSIFDDADSVVTFEKRYFPEPNKEFRKLAVNKKIEVKFVHCPMRRQH
jgi:hypothetical protein